MARKTFNVGVEYPEMNHANGRKTIAQINASLDYNKNRYPECYRWWTEVLGQSDATFMAMTVASAVLNQCHWTGNGAGFGPGVTSTSRNNVEGIPGGEYLVNVGITVLQGRFIGGGTSIGLNGNASTQFVYDHAGWIDPRPIRAVIISGNWGTSQYLESCYISDIRVTGNAPHWLDPSYTQHGIALRMMGETAVLDRVYVETCNGHGVWINGAGPGKVNHLTTFDNNLAGLYVSNAPDGSVNGNSLGMLQVEHVSGDNNAWVVLNRSGGAMKIGYLKNEDGLSASRGRPSKDQVSIEAHGWVHMKAGYVTDAVSGPSGPSFVFNSLANKSRVVIDMYEQVAANNSVDQGRSAIIADVRSKQAWRPSDQNAGEYRCMGIEWTGFGTASTLVCTEPLVSIPFNGTTRLGIASSYAGYDYAAATPVWDPTGGTVTPPAPTCTWVLGAPGAWGACLNGEETRTTPYVSSLAGCTPTTPKPADVVEKRACTVTPPPPSGGTGINPAGVALIVNTQEAGSEALATAYSNARSIPATNILRLSLGTGPAATTQQVDAIRQALKATHQEVVLCFRYPYYVGVTNAPNNSGRQSLCAAVAFGVRDPGLHTVSPLYGYSGLAPLTDKGFRRVGQPLSANYIRTDADRTKPVGLSILLLAKDQSGTPRGSARAGQTAPGLTVWDNRSLSGIGNGLNPCNYISDGCWISGRKPGTTPIVAGYQSMFQLGDPGTVVFARGFYGDHVTSHGGNIEPGQNGLNPAGQTPLTYHLDRGASFSCGTVGEPAQTSTQFMADQFVNVTVFHPLFMGGVEVGRAAWASVKRPDRVLFAGDFLCRTFGT